MRAVHVEMKHHQAHPTSSVTLINVVKCYGRLFISSTTLFQWYSIAGPREKNEISVKIELSLHSQAIYMHAHFRTTYYNLVRQVFQIPIGCKDAKCQLTVRKSVEGTHSARRANGMDDVAVPKALVSILIAISVF